MHFMKNTWKLVLPGLSAACLLYLSACGDEAPGTPEKKRQEPEKTEKTATAPAPRKKSVPAKKTFEDSEEGSLTVRFKNTDAASAPPKVQAQQDNLAVLTPDDPAAAEKTEKMSRKEKQLRQSFRTKRPENSFAAKLAPLNDGKVIRWSPFWMSESAKGVRLPAAAVSPDKSIIILAETLGGLNGPFGTRLVFLDTHSWTITAVHHLMNKDVRFIAISPDNTPVLVARGQKVFKTVDELIRLDAWTGKIKQSVPMPGLRKVYINSRGRLFAVFDPESENSRTVRVYDHLVRDGRAEARILLSENRTPVIAFLAHNQRFFLAGDKKLEQFKESDLKLLDSTPLPEGFVTASLLVMQDGTAILAPETDLQRTAIAISIDGTREFGEKSRGMLLHSRKNPEKMFTSVMNRKGRIVQFAVSSLKELQSVSPEDSRPRTVGDPQAVFVLPHCQAITVLDERGCFYLLYQDPAGLRWHKEILFRSTIAAEKR